MSSSIFSLPGYSCVRLFVSKLGKRMPESVAREELETLNIPVQGVMQLRSGHGDQDPTKNRPPNPHFIVSVAWGPKMSTVC
jgi:hypothetical protein